MSNENESNVNKSKNALTQALSVAQLAAKHGALPPPSHSAARGLPPPRTKNPLAELAAMLGRPPVKGLYYNGKVIAVDGYKFVECRFDNCKLLVNNSNFEFIDCVFDTSTVVVFNGDAMRIIRMYNMHPSMPEPPFVPTVNKNGSITITGEIQ